MSISKKDLFNNYRAEDGDTDAGDIVGSGSSSSGSGGGLTIDASVAEQVSSLRDYERIIEADGYKTAFDSEIAADVSSPMANIAGASLAMTQLFKQPDVDATLEQPDVSASATHIPETVTALAIMQKPDAKIEGQSWKHSDSPVTYKFASGQQSERNKNDVKLESTKGAVAGLEQTHRDLKAAAHDIRVDRYTSQNPTASTESKEQFQSPSAMGVAAGSAAGWGAATVMDMLLPGAGMPIRAASAATTAVQSMAVANAAMGTSNTNYDAQNKKPKSKAEARELSDSASSMSSGAGGNAYDNSTSGGEITMPKKPSAERTAFNDAVSKPKDDPVQSFKAGQIRLLEAAAAEVFEEGVEQSGHLENAKVADSAHENYEQDGLASAGLGEKIKAIESGAGNKHAEQSLEIAAAQLESPETAEKMQEILGAKLELKGPLAAGPRLK